MQTAIAAIFIMALNGLALWATPPPPVEIVELRQDRVFVNGFDSPVKARITIPVDDIAPRAAVRSEYRLVDLTDGVLEDSFAPYAVHLYDLPFSTPDDFERRKVSWPQWQRRPR